MLWCDLPAAEPDFVLCVGDDASDEKMFSSIFSFLADDNLAAVAVDNAAADAFAEVAV